MAASRKEVHHLAPGMGSRVGPAGAADPDRVSRKLSQGCFYFTLYSGVTGLELEPFIVGSIVLNHQSQPSNVVAAYLP